MTAALSRQRQDIGVRATRVSLPGVADRYALLLTPACGPIKALAVELHGSGLDVERQRSMTRIGDDLLGGHVAVLLPQGCITFQLRPSIRPGFAWHVPGAPLPGMPLGAMPATPPDDLAWIDELTAQVRTDLALGSEPTFLIGYSGGARLASHLLVQGRSLWTAAGLVAGLRHCPGDRAPCPTIAFHGLQDDVNLYAGCGDARWGLGVEETAARYAGYQGCLSAYHDERVAGGIRRTYRTPLGTAGLVMHVIAQGTHAWPGSVDREHLTAFGSPGVCIDATAEIAAFFARYIDPATGSDDDRLRASPAPGV